MQLDSFNLKKEEKKLKRYPNEQEELRKILVYIKLCNNYLDLKNNPMSKIYEFEELKYELSGYSSFRLGNNKLIRLIVKIDKETNLVKVEYISIDHYEDFKRKLKGK